MDFQEYITYLQNIVTDEMFESLVLDYLKNQYQILFCNMDEFGNKKYTIQDTFMGDTYYVIVNPSDKKALDHYALDKYMIASMDEATLFLLANHIWGQQPKKIPANARCLLPFLNELNDRPSAYFDYTCIDFAERINTIVDNSFEKYKQYVEDLYDKCVAETIKRLIQDEYLSDEKDWNRKTNTIKLTGTNGENRICECYVNAGIGCVFFTVNEPFYPMHYYLTDEKDVPLLADQIVQVLKEKRVF